MLEEDSDDHQLIVLARNVVAGTPKKYDHIDFKPPAGVAEAAERGLRMRKENGGKGGLTNSQASKSGIRSGVQRAVNLSNRTQCSPAVVMAMYRFFSRFKNNKSGPRARVAWLLWGGDPGFAWARKLKKQMEAADRESGRTASRAEGVSVPLIAGRVADVEGCMYVLVKCGSEPSFARKIASTTSYCPEESCFFTLGRLLQLPEETVRKCFSYYFQHGVNEAAPDYNLRTERMQDTAFVSVLASAVRVFSSPLRCCLSPQFFLSL